MEFVAFRERSQSNRHNNLDEPPIRASGPPAAAGFDLALAPRRRSVRSPLLLPEALDADTFETIHVSEAAKCGQYLCPFANCLGRVRLRAGHNRRRHFAHFTHGDCINPASLHNKAIDWIRDEKAIGICATELIDGGLIRAEIFGGVVRTEAQFGAAWRGKRRQRRADAEIVCSGRVLAIEFVQTHALDQAKRDDYCEYAAELDSQGKRLLLLVVSLAFELRDFYTRTEKDWRKFVLYDAPRRLFRVPMPPRCETDDRISAFQVDSCSGPRS